MLKPLYIQFTIKQKIMKFNPEELVGKVVSISNLVNKEVTSVTEVNVTVTRHPNKYVPVIFPLIKITKIDGFPCLITYNGDSYEIEYKPKEICLGVYGIKVTLGKGEHGIGGAIQSNLHEKGERKYNLAIDGVEALILAQAISGFDITSAAFLEALESTVNSLANNI